MKGTYQRAHVKLPGFLAEGSGSLKLVVAFYLSLFSKSVVNIYSVTLCFLIRSYAVLPRKLLNVP